MKAKDILLFNNYNAEYCLGRRDWFCHVAPHIYVYIYIYIYIYIYMCVCVCVCVCVCFHPVHPNTQLGTDIACQLLAFTSVISNIDSLGSCYWG